MPNPDQHIDYSGDISVRELLVHLQDYLATLLRNWYWILLACLLCGTAFVIHSVSSKNKYWSELTFMINEDETTSMGGGLGSLIGGFGLGNLGMSFNLDKILTLASSQRISKEAIFQYETIDGQHDLLANHLINYLDSTDAWAHRAFYVKPFKKESDIKSLRFKHDQIDSLSKLENKAYTVLHRYLMGFDGERGVFKTEYGEKNGIMKLSMWSHNEEIAFHTVHNIFESLSEYYVDKNIEKQQYTYDVLKVKSDSIFSDLKVAEYQLASFSDANRNLYSTKDRVTQTRLNREVQKLSILYAEVIKNLELADFTLKNKTPFIQVIDEPFLPLRFTRLGILKALIFGFALGGLLSCGWIVLRKFIRSVLSIK